MAMKSSLAQFVILLTENVLFITNFYLNFIVDYAQDQLYCGYFAHDKSL